MILLLRRLLSRLPLIGLAAVIFAYGAIRMASPGRTSNLTNGTATAFPDAIADISPSQQVGEQTAVFAGGCFWGMEAVFEHLKGVSNVVSGYAGGEAATAHYEQVSSGTTGHAESVQITYNPAQISYGQLLKIYFAVAHDPTQLNHQGPDWGTQYRSAIFFANDQQRQVAQDYINQLSEKHIFNHPIVTQVVPLRNFYAAEDYHQNFITQHPNYPYVVVNDLPKLKQLQDEFPTLYKN
jgi:peptide-methionine (S)-S-oxide reductase